jgi:hypothetical protein
VETVGKWQRAGTAVQVQDIQSHLGMFAHIYMPVLSFILP